jgi:hypothetical protein
MATIPVFVSGGAGRLASGDKAPERGEIRPRPTRLDPFRIAELVASARRLGARHGEHLAGFVNRLLSDEGLLLSDGKSGQWQCTPDANGLLSGLARLAWEMQTRRRAWPGAGDDVGGPTVVRRAVARKAFGDEVLLERAEAANLLAGGEEIRFRHLLLQAYFTAKALASRIEETPPLSAAELWPAACWWEIRGWEMPAVLLAGLYGDDCAPVIEWLRDAQPEVAAQCLLHGGAAIADQGALLKELKDVWLARLTDVESDPRPEARAAIGRALGWLYLDDRRGVDLTPEGLPDIDWAKIRGGEFIYQDGERRRLEPFSISRYPVTHAQFQAFLDAEDGYANERWWQGLDAPVRESKEPGWDLPNHPREMVNWFEAVAFCAWLGHRTGLNLRLPTEWEWERAARGTDGKLYPWGDAYKLGYANVDESRVDGGVHNLATTSAVGIYPQGASREGVMDLAGNLWEWCLNEYKDPTRIQPGGRAPRALRGGSWRNALDSARADFRGFDHFRPDCRRSDLGFRVVCAT